MGINDCKVNLYVVKGSMRGQLWKYISCHRVRPPDVSQETFILIAKLDPSFGPPLRWEDNNEFLSEPLIIRHAPTIL